MVPGKALKKRRVFRRHSSVDGLGAPTKENDWGSKLIPGKTTDILCDAISM